MSKVNVVITNNSDALQIRKGASMIFKCKNQNCLNYNQKIVTNFGYSSFDLAREKCRLECPKCSKSNTELISVGFCKADWQIKYIGHNKEQAMDNGPYSEEYEARGPIRLDIWPSVTIITENPKGPKSIKIWVMNQNSFKKIEINSLDRIVKINNLSASIEKEFNIRPQHQAFYFRGQRVYQIQPELVSAEDYVSAINIEGKSRIIKFILEELQRFFIVPIDNFKNLTLLDALYVLVQSSDVKLAFTSSIRMRKNNDIEVMLNTRLEELEDYDEITIHQKPINQPAVFAVACKWDNNPEDLTFTFDNNTIVEDVVKILSLFYETDFNKISVTMPGTVIDLKKTIAYNQIDLNSKLILNYSQEGGATGFKFINLNTGIISYNESKKAPNWRRISKGLSWKSNCENSACRANKDNPVITCKEFGNFDLNKSIAEIKCPECNCTVTPLSVGFYQAKYAFTGFTTANEQIELKGEFTDKNFNVFKEGEQYMLTYGNLEVEKLQ